jgi:hypothetical protein
MSSSNQTLDMHLSFYWTMSELGHVSCQTLDTYPIRPWTYIVGQVFVVVTSKLGLVILSKTNYLLHAEVDAEVLISRILVCGF